MLADDGKAIADIETLRHQDASLGLSVQQPSRR